MKSESPETLHAFGPLNRISERFSRVVSRPAAALAVVAGLATGFQEKMAQALETDPGDLQGKVALVISGSGGVFSFEDGQDHEHFSCMVDIDTMDISCEEPKEIEWHTPGSQMFWNEYLVRGYVSSGSGKFPGTLLILNSKGEIIFDGTGIPEIEQGLASKEDPINDYKSVYPSFTVLFQDQQELRLMLEQGDIIRFLRDETGGITYEYLEGPIDFEGMVEEYFKENYPLSQEYEYKLQEFSTPVFVEGKFYTTGYYYGKTHFDDSSQQIDQSWYEVIKHMFAFSKDPDTGAWIMEKTGQPYFYKAFEDNWTGVVDKTEWGFSEDKFHYLPSTPDGPRVLLPQGLEKDGVNKMRLFRPEDIFGAINPQPEKTWLMGSEVSEFPFYPGPAVMHPNQKWIVFCDGDKMILLDFKDEKNSTYVYLGDGDQSVDPFNSKISFGPNGEILYAFHGGLYIIQVTSENPLTVEAKALGGKLNEQYDLGGNLVSSVQGSSGKLEDPDGDQIPSFFDDDPFVSYSEPEPVSTPDSAADSSSEADFEPESLPDTSDGNDGNGGDTLEETDEGPTEDVAALQDSMEEPESDGASDSGFPLDGAIPDENDDNITPDTLEEFDGGSTGQDGESSDLSEKPSKKPKKSGGCEAGETTHSGESIPGILGATAALLLATQLGRFRRRRGEALDGSPEN